MRKITRALSLSFVFLAQTRHFSLTERNFVSGQARQSQSGMNNISTCRAILFPCHDRMASHSIPSQELSRSLCLSNAPGTNVCRYEGKTGAASEKVPIEISLPCKGGQGILGGGCCWSYVSQKTLFCLVLSQISCRLDHATLTIHPPVYTHSSFSPVTVVFHTASGNTTQIFISFDVSGNLRFAATRQNVSNVTDLDLQCQLKRCCCCPE